MNREDLIQMFMEEAEELLNDLSTSLLALEKEPNDEEIIKQLFRAAHTLKGSSGSVKNMLLDLNSYDLSIPIIESIASLTHNFESLISEVRDRGHVLSEDEFELLFSCEEKITELFDSLETPNSADIDVSKYIQDLQSAINYEYGSQKKESVQETTPKENDTVTFSVHIDLDSDFPSSSLLLFIIDVKNSMEKDFIPIFSPEEASITSESKLDPLLITVPIQFKEYFYNFLDNNSEVNSFEIDSDADCPLAENTSSNNSIDSFSFSIQLDLDANFPSSSVMVFYKDFVEFFNNEFNYSFSPTEDELSSTKDFSIIHLTVDDSRKDDVLKFLSEHAEILSFTDNTSKITHDLSTKKAINSDSPTEEKPKPVASTPPVHSMGSHSQNIKVNIDRLDDILKHVSNLVILKNKLYNQTHMEDLDVSLKNVREVSSEISQIVEFLQESVMNVRMIPLEQIFNRFPKYVRKTAKELGKDINFESFGGETEIDKVLLDSLSDPLMHLIRNSIDHGVETKEARIAKGKDPTGVISLSARHDQGSVVITIEDDGAGIDTKKVLKKALDRGVVSEEKSKTMSEKDIVNLIFNAGLSTAETVTDISGRGVGMDVVKNNIIENMQGQIDIESSLNHGTKTIIKLPLTLAIINAMLTKINGDVYAFPSNLVESVEEIYESDLKKVFNNEIYILNEKNLEVPIIRLSEFFNIPSNPSEEGKLSIIIVKTMTNFVGLTVDEFIGHEDIVLKNTGDYLGKIPGISGCNVMGNGELSLIVDVNSIVSTLKDL